MKIKYIGETRPLSLTNGKVYDVISVEKGWYRIMDDLQSLAGEEGESYLYPPELFEVVTEE